MNKLWLTLGILLFLMALPLLAVLFRLAPS